jgi:hypothetical protein
VSDLQSYFENEFTTKSDRLIAKFYADRGAGVRFDDAMTRHRQRWWRLRVWYSRHPGADPGDIRYVTPLRPVSLRGRRWTVVDGVAQRWTIRNE